MRSSRLFLPILSLFAAALLWHPGLSARPFSQEEAATEDGSNNYVILKLVEISQDSKTGCSTISCTDGGNSCAYDPVTGKIFPWAPPKTKHP